MDSSIFALEIDQAYKKYPNLTALNHLSFKVPKGEFFGLLGPNGAGKSTLIKSIVGLQSLTSGQIRVFGLDHQKQTAQAKQLIGYAPQDVNLDNFFSIRRTLEYQAGYFGFSAQEAKNRTTELLSQFDLLDKQDEQFFRLSGGMQKRCLIAKALVSNPKLLILDEPTAGVDVEQRHQLWKTLRMLKQQGTTIILTTHYIDEAETLCDRVAIIHAGAIQEIDSPKALIQKHTTTQLDMLFNTPASDSLKAQLKEHHFMFKENENSLHFQFDKLASHLPHLMRITANEPNLNILDIHIKPGTLESVFLKLTGQRFDQANSPNNVEHSQKG